MDGSVSLISIVLKPNGLDGAYIHHLLRSKWFQEEFYRFGKGIVDDLWSTKYSDMKSINIPIPSLNEQQAISTFLDRETTRIDALIEKKQHLIELLKEKRQAVITQAVTKGLDPNVPMKDSGVEWLGEVPEHWDIKRVKHYGKVIGGYAFKSTDFTDEGVPVIKITNVSHLHFDWSDSSFLPVTYLTEHKEFIAPSGALVFAMTRPIISGGVKVAILDREEACLVNQRVGFIPPTCNFENEYLSYVARSTPFVSAFENSLTATNQPNISPESIENICFACPPFEERLLIRKYLDNFLANVFKIIRGAEKSIELLQEYRSTLITAAVTGQIDVRNLA